MPKIEKPDVQVKHIRNIKPSSPIEKLLYT